MRAAILFVAAVGFVSAVPLASEQNALESVETVLAERNGPIESAILSLLENVREIMIRGTDTIPPLDPLAVGRIHVDDQALPIPGASISMTLNDMTIRGLSTFKMETLRLSMASLIPLRQRMDFDVVIPALNVDTSSYSLFLRIFGGNVFGNGDMKLTIRNARVKGNIVVAIRRDNGLFVSIHSCRISIGIDSFEPIITGMFDDEASSSFVSRFLSNLITELLDFFEVEITNALSLIVQFIGNEILKDLDLGSLLPNDGTFIIDP